MFQRARYLHDDHTNWRTVENPAASIKYDGANFFLKVEQDGSLRYFSRRPSVRGGFPERTQQLPHLTETKLPQYAGNVYNVELIHTGHDKRNVESHPAVSGILNSLPERSIATQKETGPVRAVLFDAVEPAFGTYKEKLEHLREVEKAFGKPDVMFVPEIYTHPRTIEALIGMTRRQRREGAIVTSLTKPEHSNPRVKIKHKLLYNLRVTRVIQEIDISGKPKQSAGALEVCDATGRVVANVGTGFDAATRKDIWNNPNKWIGELIQVETMGLLKPMGRLRAPVYNGIADGNIDTVE